MTIEVVSALIIERGRVLLTQRRPDQDFAGRWESPGGKVEGNESWHDAIRRELREEIDVEAASIAEHALWCGRVERPGKEDVFVLLLPTLLAEGAKPRPVEGQGIGWFGLPEFMHLPLLPANHEARVETQKAMGRQLLDFRGGFERKKR